MTGYERKIGYGARGTNGYGVSNGYSGRFKKTFNNGPWSKKEEVSRDQYWGSSGPKMETRKLMGYTIELPIIAPMAAPPEDKKLILTQTRERIEEAGTGDWNAKAQLLAQRFVVPVPNAANEAKVRLARLRDWTSQAFSFSPMMAFLGNFDYADMDNPAYIRYLSFELRVLPRQAPTAEAPVPDLPGERCIQAVLKVPLNDDQTRAHELFTRQNMLDPRGLLTAMKTAGLEITMGKFSTNRTFDAAAFDKEFRGIQGECTFLGILSVLTRDYVGKGITKDIQKRLRDCRQVQFINGRRRVKSVTEQHADFMRLVQEFDVDEQIPANLPNIAFHNASWDIQQELVHMKYEPPSECTEIGEQYKKLSEFHEKALEAESRLTQMESMMKRMRGTNSQGPASSFLAIAPPEEEIMEDGPDMLDYREPDLGDLEVQCKHLNVMLSVAEKAIRKASGEVAPLECWGCKDLPEFEKDKFHRYRSCPRRNDPRVRANFEKNLRTWTSNKRQNQYGPVGSSAQPNKKVRFAEAPRGNTFLTTLENPELGKSESKGRASQSNDASATTEEDDVNLMAQFGIMEENSGTSTRVNMARPSYPRQTKEPNSDPPRPVSVWAHKDWAHGWEQEFETDVKRLSISAEKLSTSAENSREVSTSPAQASNNMEEVLRAANALCELKWKFKKRLESIRQAEKVNSTTTVVHRSLPCREPLIPERKSSDPERYLSAASAPRAGGCRGPQARGNSTVSHSKETGRQKSPHPKNTHKQHKENDTEDPVLRSLFNFTSFHISAHKLHPDALRTKTTKTEKFACTSNMAIPSENMGSSPAGLKSPPEYPTLNSSLDEDLRTLLLELGVEDETVGGRETTAPQPDENGSAHRESGAPDWARSTQDDRGPSETDDWCLPFYPVVSTKQKRSQEQECALMKAALNKSTSFQELVVNETNKEDGHQKLVAFSTYATCDGSPPRKAIYPVEHAEIASSDTLRNWIKQGVLDFKFMNDQAVEDFFAMLAHHDYVEFKEENMLWSHTGDSLIKVTSEDEHFPDDVFFSQSYWEERENEMEDAVKDPDAKAESQLVMLVTNKAPMFSTGAAQARIKRKKDPQVSWPYPDSLRSNGGNEARNRTNCMFATPDKFPSFEEADVSSFYLQYDTGCCQKAKKSKQSQSKAEPRPWLGQAGTTNPGNWLLYEPWGFPKEYPPVYTKAEEWDNAKAAAAKVKEHFREIGPEDYALASFLAANDSESASANPSEEDVQVANLILKWRDACDRVTARSRDLSSRRIEPDAALLQHEKYCNRATMVRGEDYIGRAELPAPVDISPLAWPAYRVKGNVTDADLCFARERIPPGKCLLWGDVEIARDIRNYVRATQYRDEAKRDIKRVNWTVCNANNMLQAFQRLKPETTYCFFLPSVQDEEDDSSESEDDSSESEYDSSESEDDSSTLSDDGDEIWHHFFLASRQVVAPAAGGTSLEDAAPRTGRPKKDHEEEAQEKVDNASKKKPRAAPRTHLAHLLDLASSQALWEPTPEPLCIINVTLRSAGNKEAWNIQALVDSGTQCNLICRESIIQEARTNRGYATLLSRIETNKGNIVATKILGAPAWEPINTAVGVKLSLDTDTPQMGPSNEFPIALGVVKEIKHLPVHAIIGTNFLRKFCGNIRLGPCDIDRGSLTLQAYEGVFAETPFVAPMEDQKPMATARSPPEVTKLETSSGKPKHPLELIGKGTISEKVLVKMGRPKLRHWEPSRIIRAVKADGDIYATSDTSLYVRTDFTQSARQVSKAIIGVCPCKEFAYSGIGLPANMRITGGVMLETNGLARLFLKVESGNICRGIVIRKGQPLAEATTYKDTSNTIVREQIALEEYIRTRKQADAERNATQDQDLLAVWDAVYHHNLPDHDAGSNKSLLGLRRRPDTINFPTPADAPSGFGQEEMESWQTGTATRLAVPEPVAPAERTGRQDLQTKSARARWSSESQEPQIKTEAPFAPPGSEEEEPSIGTKRPAQEEPPVREVRARISTETRGDSLSNFTRTDQKREQNGARAAGHTIRSERSTFAFDLSSPDLNISLAHSSDSLQSTPHPRNGWAFLNMPRVHQARWQRRTMQVATTEMLPHILFPVGDKSTGQSWKSMPTVRALMDTGSGLNIGYAPYWKSVKEEKPELVKEFGKMSSDESDKLTVGGIDRYAEGTTCSHYIVLRTPFTDNGREVELRIALTDGLSCNLIFGLPFIVKSKMTINTYEKYVVSSVFQATFPLFYHPPELRESIVPQVGTPLALVASGKAK